MKQITVGVDASPESAAAVRWAAAEARLRRHPLHLVHLWLPQSRTAQTIPQEEALVRAAQLLLQEAEARVRSDFPSVRVTNELVTADSPEVLWNGAAREPREGAESASAEADGSELLVLGSEGLATVPGYLLGSVGLLAVAHAACPVVLVRAAEEPSRAASGAASRGASGAAPGPGPVAVGVSTGPGHEPVLEFAFAAAARYGTPLLAVHAVSRRVADDRATAEFHKALHPWRSRFPAVHVVEHLSHESAARAVVEIAPGAGLLVVGRGRHNAHGPQLGPVTHAAIHHARCPVATVPHP